MYTQCIMQRNSEITLGIIQHTAWIPSKFAVEGKTIEIKNDDDVWITWIVKSVGSSRLSDEVEAGSTLYKKQAQGSDMIRHKNKDGSTTLILPTKR